MTDSDKLYLFCGCMIGHTCAFHTRGGYATSADDDRRTEFEQFQKTIKTLQDENLKLKAKILDLKAELWALGDDL